MRKPMRFFALAAVAAALAATSRPAGAAGTILTSGATIASGAAPTKGAVTIDPAASPVTPPALPAIPSLGSIGSISGSVAAFPGAGAGLTPLNVTTNTTMLGGNYQYSSMTIATGVTLTITGPVTIQTVGVLRIDGLLTTAGPANTITIQTGAGFQIVSHAGAITSGISTTGFMSGISIDANGGISVTSADGSTSQIDALSGPISLTSHSAAAPLGVASCAVHTHGNGDLSVQSVNGVSAGTSVLQADAGNVTVQGFGGPVNVSNSTVFASKAATVETSHGAAVNAGSTVSAFDSIGVSAFGGDVIVSGAALVSQTGGASDVTLRASGKVAVAGASTVENLGTGAVTLTAFGGTASVESPGSTAASFVRAYGANNVALRATGDITVAGTGEVRSDKGAVSLQTTGGGITILGSVSLLAAQGLLDVRATNQATCAPEVSVAGGFPPTLSAAGVLVRAGAGGVSLAANRVEATGGTLSLLASGSVAAAGPLLANGTLTVRSTNGSVTLAGQSVTTGSAGPQSGDILIESHGGSAATIDATNATVRSGDDAAASGSVTLRIHAPSAGSSPGGTLLPGKAAVKLNRKDATRSRLDVTATLDTGGDAVDLRGAATLTVGGLVFPVTLASSGNGKLAYGDTSVSVRVQPSKLGSSRAAFTLTAYGDFRGFLDATASGAVDLRLANATVDASCRVRLAAGRYDGGRSAGALVAPSLAAAKLHATVKSGAKDGIDLTLTFATDGTTPAAAPAISLAFGDNFSASLDASAFQPQGSDRFIARVPAKGVTSLVLDYTRGTLTAKLRGVELGAFAAGNAKAVPISVSFDGTPRAIRVRMAQRGAALLY